MGTYVHSYLARYLLTYLVPVAFDTLRPYRLGGGGEGRGGEEKERGGGMCPPSLECQDERQEREGDTGQRGRTASLST